MREDQRNRIRHGERSEAIQPLGDGRIAERAVSSARWMLRQGEREAFPGARNDDRTPALVAGAIDNQMRMIGRP
jgi:hypothetical protein